MIFLFKIELIVNAYWFKEIFVICSLFYLHQTLWSLKILEVARIAPPSDASCSSWYCFSTRLFFTLLHQLLLLNCCFYLPLHGFHIGRLSLASDFTAFFLVTRLKRCQITHKGTLNRQLVFAAWLYNNQVTWVDKAPSFNIRLFTSCYTDPFVTVINFQFLGMREPHKDSERDWRFLLRAVKSEIPQQQ